MNTNITAVIPTYRNPEYLDLCLESLREGMMEDTRVIVVVDGYPEESEWVREKHKDNIDFLVLDTNVGMAQAINFGVWSATTKYVFVVNDDQVFPADWARRLISEIQLAEQKFGDRVVLTVDQVEPDGPSMFNFVIRDLGKTCKNFDWRDWQDFEYTEARAGEEEMKEDGHIFPFVVQKKWFMAIGGMDIFYLSPQVVDWDMFLKWELLGFRFPRTRFVRLYHFGSVVTRKGREAPKFRQAEQYAMEQYEYKWGANLYNKMDVNSKIPPDRKFRGFEA